MACGLEAGDWLHASAPYLLPALVTCVGFGEAQGNGVRCTATQGG